MQEPSTWNGMEEEASGASAAVGKAKKKTKKKTEGRAIGRPM